MAPVADPQPEGRGSRRGAFHGNWRVASILANYNQTQIQARQVLREEQPPGAACPTSCRGASLHYRNPGSVFMHSGTFINAVSPGTRQTQQASPALTGSSGGLLGQPSPLGRLEGKRGSFLSLGKSRPDFSRCRVTSCCLLTSVSPTSLIN